MNKKSNENKLVATKPGLELVSRTITNEEGVESTTRVPAFIEFRRHVDEMLREGSLVSKSDAIIYSIKERQFREFISRTSENNDMARLMLDGSDLIANDFEFMFGDLDDHFNFRAFSQMTSLAYDNSGMSINTEAALYVKKIIDAMVYAKPSENIFSVGHKNMVGLITILPDIYPDTEKASSVFSSILSNLVKNDPSMMFKVYGDIMDQASKAALSGNNDLLIKWPQHEKIASYFGAIEFKDRRQQVDIVRKTLRANKDVSSAIKANAIQMDPGNKDMAAHILHRRSERQCELLLKRIASSPVTALQGFGVDSTREKAHEMQYALRSFSDQLLGSSVSDETKSSVSTDIFEKFVRSKTAHFEKSMTQDYIESAKSMIDWGRIFKDIEPSVKSFVLKNTPDKSVFIQHIKSGELGDYVRDDLGM